MPTLREFFTAEATDILARLNHVVQRLDGGTGEFAELQRDARALRGSAQMAREDRAYKVSVGLETAARSLAGGSLDWNHEVSGRLRAALDDIVALVQGHEPADAADARVRGSLERWLEIGVRPPEENRPADEPENVSDASSQFMQFAAHEIAGVISEMDVSLEMIAADPRNHDPLKSMLRRQRALLGAARLDEIAVVAEALRATDDMARLIAKLNAPVKDEWLSVFRSAREVLSSSLEALQQGELPGTMPALSKLRVLRQELLERHGESESAGPVQRPASPARAPDDVVPIEQLCYSGERALRRAVELKPRLDQLAATDSDARATLEEVFDLIRLGTT